MHLKNRYDFSTPKKSHTSRCQTTKNCRATGENVDELEEELKSVMAKELAACGPQSKMKEELSLGAGDHVVLVEAARSVKRLWNRCTKTLKNQKGSGRSTSKNCQKLSKNDKKS